MKLARFHYSEGREDMIERADGPYTLSNVVATAGEINIARRRGKQTRTGVSKGCKAPNAS